MARYAAQQQLSIDELRMQLSQRLRSNAAFSSTVYQDQPIIMTGSQLKSFVPEAIYEARQIAKHPSPECCSAANVFYAQARLLAGYEDDFEFSGEFSCYYPTYEDMSNEQLRGYFSWRTKVRAGIIEKASLSFAYVYLYELMHLIGVDSAQEGYQALGSFGEAYRHFDMRFSRHFDAWLDDFVIYYGLDAGFLLKTSFIANDEAFGILEHRAEHSREELFSALVQLGGYPIEDSPFFQEHEAELVRLVTHAYLITAKHHDEKLKNALASRLSGRMGTERIWPFRRAVFADPLKIENASYEISAYDKVYCRNGIWFRTRYAALESCLPWVSQLLETCESILRDAYAYPNMLGCPIKTKYIAKAIQDMAAAMVATARMRKEREVNIDFSSLDEIRQAASVTCEKLIVEEESSSSQMCHSGGGTRREVEESRDETLRFQPCEAPLRVTEEHQLTGLECAFLALLVKGGSTREFEKEHACISSVLIDSINEKLYEQFADICIDSCGDAPRIIEDYVEELRTFL